MSIMYGIDMKICRTYGALIINKPQNTGFHPALYYFAPSELSLS